MITKDKVREIAFFDFDGTITSKDTLLEFIKFTKGKSRFYWGMLICSPFLIAFKLKLITNQRAKERVLRFFYSGMHAEAFDAQGVSFVKERLPALIRSKAHKEIQLLQEKGIEVVVVSASPENWIKPWAKNQHIVVLASKMEVRKELLTGKLQGNNCHGIEKIRRIEEAYLLSDYHRIYAYGDSSGDKAMLARATIRFYKPFR